MNFQKLVEKHGEVLLLPAHDHVFMQGDEDRNLYFIREGLLKAFYISADGKEFIKSLLMPNDFIASLTSAHDKQQCSFSLRCLQDTTLVRIAFDTVYRHAHESLEIAHEVMEMLLIFSMKKERREYEFLCLSAEERYRLLLERSPEIVKFVTQNDIARYLGITPVALSRIKKRTA